MSKKRGRPARPKLNVRTKPEDIIKELAEFAEDDPFREMMPDGYGIDYRLPLPPWDDQTLMRKSENMAILRVDPNHSNYGQMEISIVRAICGMEDYYERDTSQIGQWIYELLAGWDEETAKRVFDDILRMKKESEQSPKRIYHAYVAYCDFLEEYGFEPTRRKLAKFIFDNRNKYPVGLSEPLNGKDWWAMFFDAGLSRLEE